MKVIINNKLKLQHMADPGHGWTPVGYGDLMSLGIECNISSYSYITRDGCVVYLEEDCDVGVYIEALKKVYPGLEIQWDESYHDDDRIRGLPCYRVLN